MNEIPKNVQVRNSQVFWDALQFLLEKKRQTIIGVNNISDLIRALVRSEAEREGFGKEQSK